MATQKQIANADRFYGTVRNAISQLKSTVAQYRPAINFYNGLNPTQKSALLGMKNIDQAELESALTTLSNIGTDADSLPNVSADF